MVYLSTIALILGVFQTTVYGLTTAKASSKCESVYSDMQKPSKNGLAIVSGDDLILNGVNIGSFKNEIATGPLKVGQYKNCPIFAFRLASKKQEKEFMDEDNSIMKLITHSNNEAHLQVLALSSKKLKSKDTKKSKLVLFRRVSTIKAIESNTHESTSTHKLRGIHRFPANDFKLGSKVGYVNNEYLNGNVRSAVINGEPFLAFPKPENYAVRAFFDEHVQILELVTFGGFSYDMQVMGYAEKASKNKNVAAFIIYKKLLPEHTPGIEAHSIETNPGLANCNYLKAFTAYHSTMQAANANPDMVEADMSALSIEGDLHLEAGDTRMGTMYGCEVVILVTDFDVEAFFNVAKEKVSGPELIAYAVNIFNDKEVQYLLIYSPNPLKTHKLHVDRRADCDNLTREIETRSIMEAANDIDGFPEAEFVDLNFDQKPLQVNSFRRGRLYGCQIKGFVVGGPIEDALFDAKQGSLGDKLVGFATDITRDAEEESRFILIFKN